MYRFVVVFFLVSLLLCSVGCRLCSSPYDYCIPAHISRPHDFRGCGPLYRAGSILSGDGYAVSQMSHGEIVYVNNAGEFGSNAGNYGTTTPIVFPTVQRSSDSLVSPPRLESSLVGKPLESDPIPGPFRDPNNAIPTVEELLEQQRRGIMSEPMLHVPISPPSRPRVDVPPFETTPIEAIPFSPSDAPMLSPPPIPTSPFPAETDMDAPITLEELRRLDPSISDVQIISIEDAATGAAIY
jgi:hypothetical protein